MILNQFRLDGRVALVTGAARGLGQGIAMGLAEAGADIIVVDVLPAAETVAAIISAGRQGAAMTQDLSQTTPDSAAALIAEVESRLGPVDILVNNAGIIRRSPAIDYPWSDWQTTLHLNLSAAFALSQVVARRAVDRQGRAKIINLCSMLSYQGGINVVAYAAAKSGLAGLTKALANEWARHGVNVNALAPGYFTTEVTAGVRADPERAAAMLGRIPAGRWGEPADLKGAAVFLASDASAYVHGTILPVDGGWLAW